MSASPTLSVTLVQSVLHWEDCAANLGHFSRTLDHLTTPTDLIVLPEMFPTGFSMKAEELAEPVNGPALQWMKQQARKTNAVITGSVIVEDGGYFYNRLYWVTPAGEVQHYDKRHLFRMGDEQLHFAAGNSVITPVLKGWRVRPLVCYDLRFPVWSRNRWSATSEGTLQADYDVLLYVANWPERRNHPWKSLLTARAIENQAYVLGVNRVGNDGNDISFSGDSAVIDFKGEPLSNFTPGKEEMHTTILHNAPLAEFRKTFPVGLDADAFEIKN